MEGILEVPKKGSGFLRDPARYIRQHEKDPVVPRDIIDRLSLRTGVYVTGTEDTRVDRPTLRSVATCDGLKPDEYVKRPKFTELVSIDPDEQFRLGSTGEVTGRILDLFVPIGKGTRGLIVSPPRAGKTTILETIARGVRKSHPDTRIIALLVDERPEEVTHFRRAVDAEVWASSNDEDFNSHTRLVRVAMEHAKSQLECGRDVVILVDSLTRIARAFNLASKERGRIMSGGVKAGALEEPRRFFGMARNIENGGSVTIVASVLVSTGSKMDDLIFEEFKGTGNAEIVLDRGLANERVWPAINFRESGTRKEEKMLDPEELDRINKLRRNLLGMQLQQAVPKLIDQLDKYKTNEEFLIATAGEIR